jgi:hypothetical protein
LISDADEAGAAGTGFAHHSRDCVVIGKIRSMPKQKKEWEQGSPLGVQASEDNKLSPEEVIMHCSIRW